MILLSFLLSLLTSVVHADCNTDVPFFGPGLSICSSARQDISCGCTEYMDWDAVIFPPEANNCEQWYDVYYREVPTITWVKYGSTKWRNNPLTTRFYFAWGGIGQTLWNFVQSDILYEFTVKASYQCAGGAVTSSVDYALPVRYRGAPYRCYANGVQVPCDVLHRK